MLGRFEENQSYSHSSAVLDLILGMMLNKFWMQDFNRSVGFVECGLSGNPSNRKFLSKIFY